MSDLESRNARQMEVIREQQAVIGRQVAKITEYRQRIAELERQLAAALATVEAAVDGDGREYAEGCKP